jgi:hypothetical protein
VGLIAREIEARGIPTLSMTSALSITRSVNPPRAAFVDFPLGHTSGRPHEPELQRDLLLDSLRAFESLEEPGGVVTLPCSWEEDDAWKERITRPDPDSGQTGEVDERTGRLDIPQYQTEHDRELAEAALAAGGCETCVFFPEG